MDPPRRAQRSLSDPRDRRRRRCQHRACSSRSRPGREGEGIVAARAGRRGGHRASSAASLLSTVRVAYPAAQPLADPALVSPVPGAPRGSDTDANHSRQRRSYLKPTHPRARIAGKDLPLAQKTQLAGLPGPRGLSRQVRRPLSPEIRGRRETTVLQQPALAQKLPVGAGRRALRGRELNLVPPSHNRQSTNTSLDPPVATHLPVANGRDLAPASPARAAGSVIVHLVGAPHERQRRGLGSGERCSRHENPEADRRPPAAADDRCR